MWQYATTLFSIYTESRVWNNLLYFYLVCSSLCVCNVAPDIEQLRSRGLFSLRLVNSYSVFVLCNLYYCWIKRHFGNYCWYFFATSWFKGKRFSQNIERMLRQEDALNFKCYSNKKLISKPRTPGFANVVFSRILHFFMNHEKNCEIFTLIWRNHRFISFWTQF